MKPKEALLERRRQYLSAKIAAQRSQLAWELGAFQGPLHAFEVARGVGERIRRNAPALGMVAAVLGFALMRGGVFSKTLRTARFATKAARWLGMLRVVLQVTHRMRATARY